MYVCALYLNHSAAARHMKHRPASLAVSLALPLPLPQAVVPAAAAEDEECQVRSCRSVLQQYNMWNVFM